MTGIGLVSLQVLTGENSHLVTETVKHTMLNERLDTYMSVLKYPDKWGKVAAKNMYGWYYDTQALFNTGGNSWKKWQRVFERVLIKNQNTAGYWQTDKGHGLGESLDGRILATCWSTLQLEVYFRTLTLSDIKVKDAGPEMSISIEDAI